MRWWVKDHSSNLNELLCHRVRQEAISTWQPHTLGARRLKLLIQNGSSTEDIEVPSMWSSVRISLRIGIRTLVDKLGWLITIGYHWWSNLTDELRAKLWRVVLMILMNRIWRWRRKSETFLLSSPFKTLVFFQHWTLLSSVRYRWCCYLLTNVSLNAGDILWVLVRVIVQQLFVLKRVVFALCQIFSWPRAVATLIVFDCRSDANWRDDCWVELLAFLLYCLSRSARTISGLTTGHNYSAVND